MLGAFFVPFSLFLAGVHSLRQMDLRVISCDLLEIHLPCRVHARQKKRERCKKSKEYLELEKALWAYF